MSPNPRLTGALDDMHGCTVAVYQDRDAVRIITAGTEITLGVAGARRLLAMVAATADDADDYTAGLR